MFLLALLTLSLQDIVDDVPLLKDRPWTKSKIESYSNDNYLLQDGDDKLVVRVPRNDSLLFNQPEEECANAELAYNAGFNPIAPLYVDTRNGILISRFIEDGRFATEKDFTDAKTVQIITRAVREIHKSNLDFRRTVSPFFRIEIMHKALLERGFAIDSEIEELFNKFIALKPLIEAHSSGLVPCHNDLVPNNIVLYNDKAKFIDWEMSGLSDPVWDVAQLVVFGSMDKNREMDLLKEFESDSIPYFQDKLEVYKALIAFNSCFWAYYKFAIDDDVFPKEVLEHIYKDLTNVCQAKLKNVENLALCR